MSERSRLLELLRKWEHPNKWIEYNSARETSFEAYKLAEDLGKDRDVVPSPDLEKKIKRIEEIRESCLEESAKMGVELLELRRLIESDAPRLVGYFPPVEGIRDFYKPDQRAEMVRIVLGKILDGNGKPTKTNIPASASKRRPPPKVPKNPLVQMFLSGIKNPKNKDKTKHEIAMGITEDDEKKAKSVEAAGRRYLRAMDAYHTSEPPANT